MKLRCPYCRGTFESPKRDRCPRCGKYVRVPGKLRKDAAERTQRRRKSARRPGITTTPARGLGGGRSSLTIVGILAVFLVLGGLLIRDTAPSGAAAPGDCRPAHAQDELNVLAKALELYKEDCGHYPPVEDGLLALVRDPGTWAWDGPYVTLMRPDPWGERYQYSVTNKTVILFCAGIDGRVGTADDIAPTALPEP